MGNRKQTPWFYIDPNRSAVVALDDDVVALDDALDAHNTVQKRIDATRQSLPRLSDAIVKCENDASRYRSISPYCIEVDPSFYLGGE